MLNECTKCGTLFAVDLKQCPHCGSKQFHEQGTKRKSASKKK